jgi:branched-chain amino acid transport system ATP-binding protein
MNDPAEATGPATEASDAPASDPHVAVLELDDVYAGYNQFRALFGISLTIGVAQAVALIGPNGVGKTTLARVASGLITPTAGRVKVSGHDLTGREAHDFARAGIAHAPEGRSVFGTLSVEENLLLPFRRQFGRAGQGPALEKAYGLFPRLGERRRQEAGSLSGGEQRMLTLARVLVLEPKLLIADELSLGLAPIITNEVYDVLRRILAAGTALLVIEQQVEHALSLADHVVVLERGQITSSGPPDMVDATAESFR